MEETELIQLSKEGDIGSFNRLVEFHERGVYNLAFRMLGDAQAAEDATQETFISAYRALRGFRGGDFRAWLLKIAANKCRDQLRALRRRPIASLDSMEEDGVSLIHAGEPPEDYAIRRELGREIEGGLLSLPPDQRLAVILSDIQGLSYKEIARVTASSIGTVRSRLSRGRARLRDYLLERGELSP